MVELLGPGGAGAAAAAAAGGKPVFVRVNAVGTRHAHADVEAVAALPVAGIRVPKVEGEGHVRTVVGWLEAAGRGMWQQPEPATLDGLRQVLLDTEGDLEGR